MGPPGGTCNVDQECTVKRLSTVICATLLALAVLGGPALAQSIQGSPGRETPPPPPPGITGVLPSQEVVGDPGDPVDPGSTSRTGTDPTAATAGGTDSTAVAGVAVDRGGALAQTGIEVTTGALLAGGLLLAGGASLAVARKRRVRA